ncbi:hypothetical protein [Xylocopilactobacillus apis]|uniref:DUF2508 domain-containing protein n=1 Tax=Xylocopilactobacillus apis TaxID=2932183 RepID=A0AAU9CRU0_9LACO|nr:hypothetical protein [Xylocopilactobacillus apis]BDR56662.1 hypothetical protein KIMC2_12240 [Xylocopilactobacillus apis]
MRKIRNIDAVYNKQLFAAIQQQLSAIKKLEHYDELAIDQNEQMQAVEIVHKHLYYFYLRHLRQEKVMVREVINEKEKQVEVVFGTSGK